MCRKAKKINLPHFQIGTVRKTLSICPHRAEALRKDKDSCFLQTNKHPTGIARVKIEKEDAQMMNG